MEEPVNNQNQNPEQVYETLTLYLPFLQVLVDHGVEFCTVGGVAVLLQCVQNDYEYFRITKDIDLLVSNNIKDIDVLSLYVEAYAKNEEQADVIREINGYEDFRSYQDDDYSNMNFKIVGANEIADGFETPSVDICFSLNGLTVDSIHADVFSINDLQFKVADVETLSFMKKSTIELLGANIVDSSRPNDFRDFFVLNAIKENSQRQKDNAPPSPKASHQKHLKDDYQNTKQQLRQSPFSRFAKRFFNRGHS